MVWPNYVKDHAFLFDNGNVEGEIRTDTTEKLKIEVMPKKAEGDMTECLRWAHGVLEDALGHRNNYR